MRNHAHLDRKGFLFMFSSAQIEVKPVSLRRAGARSSNPVHKAMISPTVRPNVVRGTAQ
jgi:hypothetical protein